MAGGLWQSWRALFTAVPAGSPLAPAAAQQAFAGFLDGRVLNARQIEFVQTIIENLTQTGVVAADRLYEAPYTRLSSQGVHGVFREAEVVQLITILDEVKKRAVA